MRLFIGCFVRIEGYETIRRLFEPCLKGKWVREANLHLTWRFLGDVDDPQPIIEALSPLRYPKGQKIGFERFGMFGKKILYADSDNQVLFETAEAVDALLGERGREEKAFVPHVTLMRIKHTEDPECLKPLPDFPKEASLCANLEVALVESELTEAGARYRVLKVF